MVMDDDDRFRFVMRKIVGKRPTYKELIGKLEDPTQAEDPFLRGDCHAVRSSSSSPSGWA